MTKKLTWKQEIILSLVFFGIAIVSSSLEVGGPTSSIPGFFMFGGIILLPLGIVEFFRVKRKKE